MPDFWAVDNAAWRKALELHAHDGSAWRKAQQVYVHDGGAWRLVYVAFTFTAINESAYGAGFYDPPWSNIGGSAGIRYNTDGTTTLLSNYGNTAGTNWGSGSPFTDKYVRCRSYTGDTPNSGNVGSWQQLNANRSWQVWTTVGTDTAYTELTIDFSTDGVNISKTVTVYLTVEASP